jgi:hypothetical protein
MKLTTRFQPMGINLLERSLDFLWVFSSKVLVLVEDEKVKWLLKCVGLEHEDSLFD